MHAEFGTAIPAATAGGTATIVFAYQRARRSPRQRSHCLVPYFLSLRAFLRVRYRHRRRRSHYPVPSLPYRRRLLRVEYKRRCRVASHRLVSCSPVHPRSLLVWYNCNRRRKSHCPVSRLPAPPFLPPVQCSPVTPGSDGQHRNTEPGSSRRHSNPIGSNSDQHRNLCVDRHP